MVNRGNLPRVPGPLEKALRVHISRCAESIAGKRGCDALEAEYWPAPEWKTLKAPLQEGCLICCMDRANGQYSAAEDRGASRLALAARIR